MTADAGRIILVDPSNTTRELVARRLRAQGYVVEEAADPAAGADMALCTPPAAVVADLWMPSISGVQLCRLLRSEPATAEVPVILCGDTDEPRNRFWADRAGANAYVPKRRTGDLVRALRRAVLAVPAGDGFFFQLGGGTIDVRDRIARHLDEALFDSVIAAEVRALAACGSFDRLFDLFAQFLSQVSRYRWLAIATETPPRLAIHHHPSNREGVDVEARAALGLSPTVDTSGGDVFRVEDDDASATALASGPIVRTISLGTTVVGRVALSPCSTADEEAADKLLSLVARELGGPLRMTSLVEESQRLASTDTLTGISNRRAFTASMLTEIARSNRHGSPLSLVLLDVDHFKKVNDVHGHSAGDRVLASLGTLLRSELIRGTDLTARWGGEEFVVAYPSTSVEGAASAAERLRCAIEQLVVEDEHRIVIPVTASLGLAELHPGESLESFVARADTAMYESKTKGRNRLTRSANASVKSVAPGASSRRAPPMTV